MASDTSEGCTALRVEEVSFYSGCDRLAGTLKLQAIRTTDGPCPPIVHGLGSLGMRDANPYRPYHDSLVEVGIAVLAPN